MAKLVARRLTIQEMESRLISLRDRLEDVQDTLNVAKARCNKMERRIERAKTEAAAKPAAPATSIKK